ncbi:hypothetical protein HK102_002234 [Quaeritorhiza haematococci]|nr:hypothetical protein HK102_002234 [Quaeritorhiza haematococci]
MSLRIEPPSALQHSTPLPFGSDDLRNFNSLMNVPIELADAYLPFPFPPSLLSAFDSEDTQLLNQQEQRYFSEFLDTLIVDQNLAPTIQPPAATPIPPVPPMQPLPQPALQMQIPSPSTLNPHPNPLQQQHQAPQHHLQPQLSPAPQHDLSNQPYNGAEQQQPQPSSASTSSGPATSHRPDQLPSASNPASYPPQSLQTQSLSQISQSIPGSDKVEASGYVTHQRRVSSVSVDARESPIKTGMDGGIDEMGAQQQAQGRSQMSPTDQRLNPSLSSSDEVLSSPSDSAVGGASAARIAEATPSTPAGMTETGGPSRGRKRKASEPRSGSEQTSSKPSKQVKKDSAFMVGGKVEVNVTSDFTGATEETPVATPASTSGSASNTPAANKKRGGKELLTEEEKRANHIASEQKRRNLIRGGFKNLADLVPGLKSAGNGASSKSVILYKSVDFIRSLQYQNQVLLDRLKVLQQRFEMKMAVQGGMNGGVGVPGGGVGHMGLAGPGPGPAGLMHSPTHATMPSSTPGTLPAGLVSPGPHGMIPPNTARMMINGTPTLIQIPQPPPGHSQGNLPPTTPTPTHEGRPGVGYLADTSLTAATESWKTAAPTSTTGRWTAIAQIVITKWTFLLHIF